MQTEKLERDTLRCEGKEVRGSIGKEVIKVLLVKNGKSRRPIFQTIVTYGGVLKEWIVEKERRIL
jgi:hypothetical protein